MEAAEGQSFWGDGFGIAMVGLMLAIFGVVVGFDIGSRLGEQAEDKKTYWKYNAYAYLVGIAVSALIWATGWVVVSFATIGMLGGCIAGLKMSFGQSVGPWAGLDRFFRPNRPRRPRANAKTPSEKSGWARRKPEGAEDPDEPELISVADPDAQDPKKR